MNGSISRSSNQSLQLYQNINQPTMVQSWFADAAGDATTVISKQVSRVTRPINTRRRSRASRKTPTTLLTTDTTNFRAMVQRFTGGGNSDGTSGLFLSNESSMATSTDHQFLNTNYNSINSSRFNDGVALHPNDSYNMQLPPPHSQPYFMMPVDYGGSTTAQHEHGYDQHMGGSFKW